MYLNYHIYTGGSDKRKRRDDLIPSGISLNEGPVISSNSQIFAEDPRKRCFRRHNDKWRPQY